MRWYSVWDLTLIVMYTCIHTLAPYRTNLIYSLLPCWWTDKYAWVISLDITCGEPMGDVLFLLRVPSSSLLLFLSPFCCFLCSLCLVSSLLVFRRWSCVCQLFFFGGGEKAECLWSINPLNAIKHTMHRRWPFKTCTHFKSAPAHVPLGRLHHVPVPSPWVLWTKRLFHLTCWLFDPVIFTEKKKITVWCWKVTSHSSNQANV